MFEGQATVLVRESPAPRVEIALADRTRVDWEQYPELDRDEPDARVVAQALSVQAFKCLPRGLRVVVASLTGH